jgi:hypothetical protein
MMTTNELARMRRQMHRRIRVVLALRRADAPASLQRPADRPAGGSAEPTPQD